MPIINPIFKTVASSSKSLSWYATGSYIMMDNSRISVDGVDVYTSGYGVSIPSTETVVGSYPAGSTVQIYFKTDIADGLNSISLYLNDFLYGSATSSGKGTHTMNQTFTLQEDTVMKIVAS